jgi:excisionase family DNA binding protein
MSEAFEETKSIYSVPEVARRIGVDPDKVLRWIKNRQLKAYNVAEFIGPNRRPRWRITAASLAEFLERRAAGTPATAPRRAEVTDDVIEFFP